MTGVGAKTALGVLPRCRCASPVAIVTGDIAALSRAGHRQKTAQRIVLELKDKVEQQDVSAPAGSAALGFTRRRRRAAGGAGGFAGAGYTSAEAARAINLVRDQADTVDALIMLALRQIGSFNPPAKGDRTNMKLPEDPVMLLSFVNMKLRDQYASLTRSATIWMCRAPPLEAKLGEIGYFYNAKENRFA
ncbi:MAG: DUF4250 family protein [Christensenellales bacterium]